MRLPTALCLSSSVYFSGCLGAAAGPDDDDDKCGRTCGELRDAARVVDEPIVELSPYAIPTQYPEVASGGFSLGEVEHRAVDAFPVAAFDGGTDDMRRCMVAAVYRFEAIFEDSEASFALVAFSQMMSDVWNRSLRNVVEAEGTDSGRAQYVASSGSVLWVSRAEGSRCHLPTRDEVIDFLQLCPSDEPRCNASAPIEWAPTRDVHRHRVDLRDIAPPATYPEPRLRAYHMETVEALGSGARADSYESASESAQRCVAASAYRFEAIFGDARAKQALDMYREATTGWSGEIVNASEARDDATTGALEQDGAALWWRSQIAPDLSCYLPTYAMVMEFLQRCAGSAGCASSMPDRWGAAGNVSRAEIDLRALSAPPAYPAPRVTGYPLEDVEYRDAGATMSGYESGGDDERRCAAAAAYRFEAIFADDAARAAVVSYRSTHPAWSGSFVNVNERRATGGVRLEQAGPSLLWVSQTRGNGICGVPTLDSVIAFLGS